MLSYFQRLVPGRDEEGASAVEYGLLVAAVAALIVIIVFAFGGLIRDVFNGTCKTIDDNTTMASAASCT